MTEQKNYVISETHLKYLIRRDMIFKALEQGGVDNWDFYEDSIYEYEENNGEIPDMENIDVSTYEEIK